MSASQHEPLRVCIRDFWAGFDAEEVRLRFPELARAAAIEFVEDVRDADLVLFSCFPGGVKDANWRDPLTEVVFDADGPARPVRLFYTAEDLAPDFTRSDFAISFQRGIIDPRHLRQPNSIGAFRVCGIDPERLGRPRLTGPEAASIRASKTRFCAYVQGHQVPFREDFVRRLSRYRTVDCAGPSLNNTGFQVDRFQKYDLFRESKFAVTFENTSSVGYVTEKLPDALVSETLPIYWGDPTADLDFNPRAFLWVRSAADVDRVIEQVMDLDRDDAAYEAVLGAQRFPAGTTPADYQTSGERAFFGRVLAETRRRQGLRELGAARA